MKGSVMCLMRGFHCHPERAKLDVQLLVPIMEKFMTTAKSGKQNKKSVTAKSHPSKSAVKNATKKAMAQYGNALRNLANR